MSLHRDQFVSATNMLWDRFSEPADYTVAPADSSESAATSEITVIWRLKGNSGSSSRQTQSGGCLVRASEVSAPKRADTIQDAAGKNWRVINIETERAGVFRLYVEHKHEK